MKDIYALFRHSLAGLRLLVAMTVLLGIAYPLAVLGVARVAFPWQANGSLITATGTHTTDPHDAVGSAIIGQLVRGDGLFQPRPSAGGYDMLSTGGTNLGPDSPALVRAIRARRAAIAARDGVAPAAVPPDAVTASASGLDPDISPAYAAIQVPRVAAANGLTQAQVRRLVAQHTAGRTWGVLGEPHVNVLDLNIAVLRLRAGLAGS